MRSLHRFSNRSFNQSPIPATQFNAYSGNMKYSMTKKISSSNRKQTIKFNCKSKNDIVDPLKLVRRFDTDERDILDKHKKLQNADLLSFS